MHDDQAPIRLQTAAKCAGKRNVGPLNATGMYAQPKGNGQLNALLLQTVATRITARLPCLV